MAQPTLCQHGCPHHEQTERLYSEVLEHRKRLGSLHGLFWRECGHLYQQLPDLEKWSATFLHFHDLPKIQDLSRLARWGYKHEHSIACRLGSHYGSNLEHLESDRRSELEEAIHELNRIEEKQKRVFYIKVRALYPAPIGEKIVEFVKWLEIVMDATDTAMNRHEELGLVNAPFKASEWLSRHGHSKAAFYSMLLERHLRGSTDELKTAT